MEEEYVDEEMEPDPVLNRVTNAIIGAAIAVHKELGPGHLEATYANALELEFLARGIRHAREAKFPILYRNQRVGEGRLDFLVEGSVVLELKAVETMTPLFKAQVISYLKVTKRRLALLINFNVRKLVTGIQRIAL